MNITYNDIHENDETPDSPRDWAFDYVGEIGELKTKRDDADVNQYASEEDAKASAVYMLENIVMGLSDKDLVYYWEEIFPWRAKHGIWRIRKNMQSEIIENEKQYISTYNMRQEEADADAQRQEC